MKIGQIGHYVMYVMYICDLFLQRIVSTNYKAAKAMHESIIHIYIHIHTHTHTYIHTDTHTHTHTSCADVQAYILRRCLDQYPAQVSRMVTSYVSYWFELKRLPQVLLHSISSYVV